MPLLPLFTGILHLAHVLTVPPTKACLLCATPAGMDLYIQVPARRHLPSAVPWISEDRLLIGVNNLNAVSERLSRQTQVVVLSAVDSFYRVKPV